MSLILQFQIAVIQSHLNICIMPTTPLRWSKFSSVQPHGGWAFHLVNMVVWPFPLPSLHIIDGISLSPLFNDCRPPPDTTLCLKTTMPSPMYPLHVILPDVSFSQTETELDNVLVNPMPQMFLALPKLILKQWSTVGPMLHKWSTTP